MELSNTITLSKCLNSTSKLTKQTKMFKNYSIYPFVAVYLWTMNSTIHTHRMEEKLATHKATLYIDTWSMNICS